MKRNKKVGFLIITIALNFISCATDKYYQIAYGYFYRGYYYPFPERPDYYDETVYIDSNNGYYPFFTLSIQANLKKIDLGIKNITINKMEITTENAAYDMKTNIYQIYFMETIYNGKNIQIITDLKNFYNTGSIDIPIDAWFSGCRIYGRNPGIKYWANPNITVLLDIKIEMEDGTIEQKVREFKGKRKIELHSIFPLTV
jgi:hypothetical protein